MTPPITDPDELVALGAFTGAQVLVVIFSAIKANAYQERAWLLHAAATLVSVLAVQALAAPHPVFPEAVLLVVMAVAGLQMRDLMAHAGGLRSQRRWLVGVSVAGMPLLALAALADHRALLAGAVAWAVVVAVMLRLAWRQSRPWVWSLLPGVAALPAAAVALAVRFGALPVAALLALWAASVYFATDWRGRIVGETRARVDARNTIDPLTGLSTPLVLTERLHAARTMMRRYGHPSVLLLVHIENLARISEEFGPEAAEAAVLAAANRVRQSLREGDVAARLAHSRIAVLVEGMSAAEASGNVAGRILVAGLKEPLPSLPAEFLQFRIALAPVPDTDFSAKALLGRLAARLDQQLHAPSDRRIVTLTHDEVTATTT